MTEPELLVDPVVSKAKFDREIARYRELENDFLRQGWWMLEAHFPKVFVVFATPHLKPPSVIFGALLDFSNYDLWPPSVQLVDPFIRTPYPFKELPTPLPRQINMTLPTELLQQLAAHGLAVQPPHQHQPIMQAHNPEDVPFMCLPGVREYHMHPAHTGDSWFLHRGCGEGTLYFILEKLYYYGVKSIKSYGFNVQVNIGYQVAASE